MTTLTPVTVPFDGTCPRCAGRNVRLEAVGPVVDIVHDDCGHRAYSGPVAGLRPSSPLALEVALSR
jgi:hypothetical protein